MAMENVSWRVWRTPGLVQLVFESLPFLLFCVFPLCAQHSLNTPLYQEMQEIEPLFQIQENKDVHCIVQ